MKYKIVAITKEGVRFEVEVEEYDEMLKRVTKLRKQDLIVEVYEVKRFYPF